MSESELTEFELENGDLKLRISRNNGQAQVIQAAPAQAMAPVVQAAAPATPAGDPAPADDGSKIITSPMVGTFYRSPSPDSASFVDVGAKIQPDSVVCIVEAMKVMNEIQADIAGEIIEILVENEQSVEFGQPLFKVKPV